jgi:hypothetical protein
MTCTGINRHGNATYNKIRSLFDIEKRTANEF